MRSVTEFATLAIKKGLAAKTALATEGKTPEEISAALGESFKLEGEKLKYFEAAMDVGGQNMENLKRVMVISLSEGETAPPKAQKVDEMYFLPEYFSTAKPAAAADSNDKGGRGGGRGGPRRGGGEKKGGSPWGITPEEKAAKAKAAAGAKKG